MSKENENTNFSDLAEFVYNELDNILRNNEISGRDKISALWNLQNDFLAELTKNEKISFTEFARFHFVIHKYQLPLIVKTNFIRFKKFRNFLRKNKNFQVEIPQVNHYKQTISDLVAYIIFAKLPIETTEEDFIEDKDDKVIKENIFLRFLFAKQEVFNENIILHCLDEDGEKAKIICEKSQENMVKMLWRSSTISISNLEQINSIIKEKKEVLENDEEIYLKEEIKCYKTNPNSIIIAEPDYLIDVTEIAHCFTSRNEFPIIPIVNKFLLRKTGTAAFKGNIVNHFFDELLENIECDFDTALKRSLSQKPLAMLVYEKLMKLQEISKEENTPENTLEQQLQYFRVELYYYFTNLRNIIKKNYLSTKNYTEPSFISKTYGLQGRLDLMAIDDEQNINIVELKSGKAPNQNIKIKLGLDEKREIILPLWINHYVQIICYNILLKQSLNYKIGNSSILYAKPKINAPLRSVVDNDFVWKEIIIMRNWIIAYQKELAQGNLHILTSLTSSQINTFPSYLQDEVTKKVEMLSKLSELELNYFRTQVAFITKEIFACKIGLYSDNRRQGFSSLWLDSIEEKKQKNSIISQLQLNVERSNFEEMHLAFDRFDKHDFTAFRKGDICVIYPQINENESQTNILENQLLRGRISYIDDREIIISLRNKLSQNIFISNPYWCLEADYIDMLSSSIYSSISQFIFSAPQTKEIILGQTQPKFSRINSKIKQDIEVLDIQEEKKEILKKAIKAENYFLIQGPPGTGKTSYILRYLTKILFERTNENILILAYTNRAADEICNALHRIDENFPFLRLGNHDSSQHISKLISFVPLEELSEKVKETRIFVSTVSSANNTPELFELKEFDTIIVDEATQILESHLIGLLSKVQRFIMIGDEKQLPAVTSVSAKELQSNNNLLEEICFENLQDSLFERLLKVCKKNKWNAYAMLTEQSRMQPEVMNLCNSLFYKGKLSAHQFDTKSSYRKNVFINTPCSSKSKMNLTEVEFILKIIKNIENEYKKNKQEFNEKSIGIISPWRVQCGEILKRLTKEQQKYITVDTVERFQGSERDIIIFSTATNSLFLLDLLSESKIIDKQEIDRKLNVSISRAKQQFILLGNKELLSQKAVYKNLIELLEEVEIK